MSSFRESISAFGPHKHKIALSTASAAAIACAVFGSTMGQTPAAHAAAAATTAHVSQESVAVAAPKATASASPSAPATSPSTVATTATAAAAPTTKAAPATTSSAPAATATTTKAAATTTAADPYAGLSAYQIAEKIVPAGQFAAFSWIITHESGWDVTATNASSGAYGLGQALPASKMAAYGSDYLTNPVTQIKWALAYMNERYGSPNAAQVWWENHGWY